MALAGGAIFVTLLLPGLITYHPEFMRVAQVFPFLVLGSAYGLRRILGPWNARTRLLLLSLVAVSYAVDLYNLGDCRVQGGTDHTPSIHDGRRLPEYRRAYDLVRERVRREGTGYLFTDFLSDPIDRTLWFATMPYNALEGAGTPGVAPRWAALVVNAYYVPFLEKRFPGSSEVLLSKDVDPDDGGKALVFLPLSGPVPVPLERWQDAHRVFSMLTARLIHSSYIHASNEGADEILEKNKRSFEKDPFLESLYWERVFQNRVMERKWGEAIGALEEGLRKGCRAAHLFNELGVLRAMAGDKKGARSAFRSAMSAPGNRTEAAENLERLK
jgi:hypothetical protein